MTHYDAIVLGVGGVGSAALYHLAGRGLQVAGVDRFSPGHDRGSSHGQTRIIRQAYFEHPDYVPMALRSYQLWEQLAGECGETLFVQTGLLQMGPPDGAVVEGVLESARRHQLPIEQLSPAEVQSRWPGICCEESQVGLFEQRAGYLHVERCVQAHAEQATQRGAELLIGHTIHGWRIETGKAIVETDRGRLTTDRLIITPGAWASELLQTLGLSLKVHRKVLFWLAAEGTYRAESGYPAYLYELPEGVFYGFPSIDAREVKVAEHSGGAVVADPLAVDRDFSPADLEPVTRFTRRYLPLLSDRVTRHAVCMYTMTADEHFVVDRHREHPRVAFAAGLSGHGFKFTPTLGKALADLVTDGSTDLPIGFLNSQRPGLARALN